MYRGACHEQWYHLVISATEAQIGTLDTTQDSVQNNAATGNTLLADGSYTTDDNCRADFTTVGSVLAVNMGSVGDVVKATDMKLSDATLIKMDAKVDGSRVSSDVINASGTIHAAATAGLNHTSTATAPSTARVYIAHADLAAASEAEEGGRTTIMTGRLATHINEDVLYDVAVSSNGTYQRTLLESAPVFRAGGRRGCAAFAHLVGFGWLGIRNGG